MIKPRCDGDTSEIQLFIFEDSFFNQSLSLFTFKESVMFCFTVINEVKHTEAEIL